MFTRLVERMLGPPPPAGSSSADRLRWVRRIYRFNWLAIIVVVVFAALGGGTYLWIAAGVVTVAWLAGLASISFNIRRAEARDR